MSDFRSLVRNRFEGGEPMSAYDGGVGARLDELGDGRARMTVAVDGAVHNPAGVVHGGVLCGLADSAMAYAVSTTLGEGESVTNIDLTVRFLRATVTGTLTANASVLRAGRRVVVVECAVANEAGEAVAKASSTFLRLAAKGGAGWLGGPR